MGFCLKNHEIFIGKSPLITVHWVLATSPELMTSSPKVRKEIWGGTTNTKKIYKLKMEMATIWENGLLLRVEII